MRNLSHVIFTYQVSRDYYVVSIVMLFLFTIVSLYIDTNSSIEYTYVIDCTYL